MSDGKAHSRWHVAATVLFYMFAALAMVMVNKWVLNSTTTPLFFLLAQLLIAVVLFVITNAVGFFKISLKLDAKKCKGLLPMVFINVVGLSSNNYCLKYVDASFYQVARGLVLPLTVIFSVLFLRNSRPSVRIFVACGVVTVGFFVGVFLDGSYNTRAGGKHPSFLGIFFGILSSMTTAAHAVVIKKSLEVVNGDAIELSWYSNILSSVLLMPLIVLAGEVPDILNLISTPVFSSTGNSHLATFLWGSIITGIVGWMLSIAGVLSIKITSPITHMISSAVRGILQSLMGVHFFGDIVTVGRGSSIGIILGGSCYYTWVKNEEYVAKRELEANGGVMHDVERGNGNGHNGYTYLPMKDTRKSNEIDIDAAIRELEGENDHSKPRHSKSGDEA